MREWLKRLPRLETLLSSRAEVVHIVAPRIRARAEASPRERTLFDNLQLLLQTSVGDRDTSHSRSPAALETIAVAVYRHRDPSLDVLEACAAHGLSNSGGQARFVCTHA